MNSPKTVLIVYDDFPYQPWKPLPNATYDEKLKYFSDPLYPYGRFLLTLLQYLQQYTEFFKRINVLVTYHMKVKVFGLMELGKDYIKKMNDSEIDIGYTRPYWGFETENRYLDFAYPYLLDDYTFITQNPKYKPHIFGIFQKLSLPVWITIISFLFSLPLLKYNLLKRKYTLSDVSFPKFLSICNTNEVKFSFQTFVLRKENLYLLMGYWGYATLLVL